MFLKRKIRRAFRNATPDMLPFVPEHMPEPRDLPQMEPERKRPSRIREFAATAAAIVMLLSVGSGLVWFVGNGSLNFRSASQSTSPTLDPDCEFPLMTEGPPVTDYIGEEEAVNLALQLAFPPVGEGPDLSFFAGAWHVEPVDEDGMQGYRVTLEFEGAVYNYLFSNTGDVLDTVVEMQDVIPTRAARDIALEEAGISWNDMFYLRITLNETAAGEPVYRVEVASKTTWFDITVDARLGTVVGKEEFSWAEEDWYDREDLLDWREAVQIAVVEFGDTPELLGCLKVSASGSAEEPYYEVSVSFVGEPWIFYLHIDAATGDILYVYPNVGQSSLPEKPQDILSPEEVLTIAVLEVPEDVRVALGAGVDGYTCKAVLKNASGQPYYETTIASNGFAWRFLQDPYTGKFLMPEVAEEKIPFTASAHLGGPYPDPVVMIRSYEELLERGLDDLADVYDEAFFENHTLIGIAECAPSSAECFRVTGVYRLADGSYQVTTTVYTKSVGNEALYYWGIYVAVNERLPEDAMIHYTCDTDPVRLFEGEVPEGAKALVRDALLVDTGDGTVQWICDTDIIPDQMNAIVEYDGTVYIIPVESGDLNGDGVLDILLPDENGEKQVFLWDPSVGWYVYSG